MLHTIIIYCDVFVLRSDNVKYVYNLICVNEYFLYYSISLGLKPAYETCHSINLWHTPSHDACHPTSHYVGYYNLF